jgi:hypothetical protein
MPRPTTAGQGAALAEAKKAAGWLLEEARSLGKRGRDELGGGMDSSKRFKEMVRRAR